MLSANERAEIFACLYYQVWNHQSSLHTLLDMKHRAHRSYLWWQAKGKFYSRSHESPLFTVESTINFTYQTVMRSCFKPGKILNESKSRPMGDEFGNEAFRARHEVPRRKRNKLVISSLYVRRCYSSAVIALSGFAEYWFMTACSILQYKKQRRCAVLTVKFNYNQ